MFDTRISTYTLVFVYFWFYIPFIGRLSNDSYVLLLYSAEANNVKSLKPVTTQGWTGGARSRILAAGQSSEDRKILGLACVASPLSRLVKMTEISKIVGILNPANESLESSARKDNLCGFR